MKCIIQYGVFLILIASLWACNKDKNDIEVATFEFKKPSYFPEPSYNFSNNIITKERFELGRKLFYDPILSANNTISCGSCHIQTSAFTHHGHSVSHGIYDRMGTRNSPPIMNLAWNNSFMWDGGINDLDLQSIAPITNHVEMDDSMPNVLSKLRNHPQYPALFKNAFGNDEITGTIFLKALSQFMLMCNSVNAKYDSVRLNKAVFTEEELLGYEVFKTKCNQCHTEPLFTNYDFVNNGLSISLVNDLGRYVITNNNADKYKFKVPSLRNLSFTAPYMHDGRLLSIDAVLTHYTHQVQPTPNLHPVFSSGSSLGIEISDTEKTYLKAFLKTLDDKSFLFDNTLSEQ